MHALLSSVVEIHEHQVEVVRRVLQDPKQRYLLADEVGLGKTIEAGLIIRQYLLDNPEGHVVVITPPLLRRQWVTELREKFLIDDFSDATIAVLSHDEPESWSRRTTTPDGQSRSHHEAGLLVVDEVHNLAALEATEDQRSVPYTELARLTAAVPRLLLLSATPLLNNERTFLAMLHLLDPDIYRLSDSEGFAARVRGRREWGTTFFTFTPEAPAFLLREKVESLRTLFPNDEQLLGLLGDVSVALDSRASEPTTRAVAAARAHISETYRIHRRLLRTRRSAGLLTTFPVHGRRRPSMIASDDATTDESQVWLDDWREYTSASVEDATPSEREHAITCFQAFADRAGSGRAILEAAAQFRAEPSSQRALAAELTRAEADALESLPLRDAEIEILSRVAGFDTGNARLANLTEFLRTNRRQTIVFTSFALTARDVGGFLRTAFGEEAVAFHLQDLDPSTVEEELDRFRANDERCWLLLCDRSAEEGRNLQFAQQAVHFDVPLSPNRMEQRIGRLDRFGRGVPTPTFMSQAASGSIAEAWLSCLTEGFEIFDQSLASLQFAVDEILPEALRCLLERGVEGLDALTPQLPAQLSTERIAVNEQDALDAIEAASSSHALIEALDDLEDLWFQIQRATEGLLSETLGNLRFHRAVDPADDKFRSYRLTRPGKTPHLNSMPLVAWDVLLSRFRPVVEQTGSYFRRAAINRPGARLFRIGEPLIDALTDYERWDDRGQTFAYLRPDAIATDDVPYFRFDYVVEADTTAARAEVEKVSTSLDAKSLQRSVDQYLPPFLATIWTTFDGLEVRDLALCDRLSAPYDPATGDLNLNNERRWFLEQIVGASDWEFRCREARESSERELRGRSEFEAHCAHAQEALSIAVSRSRLQRTVRLAFLGERERKAEEAALAIDSVVNEALKRGVLAPLVRLDSVGVVLLSAGTPNGPGFPEARR